ncbi:MAG: tetratricopeptide repeat protein, partial [Devosia sp.]
MYRVTAPYSLPRIRFWMATSGLALLLCGCATNSAPPNYRAPDFSGQSQTQLSQTVGALSQRYKRDPSDRNIVIPYSAALRSAGQPEQAIAALEQAMSRAKGDPALRVEYARALVAAGRFEQALNVIDDTINPAAPDWTMLSIKGAALDQLGRHDEARGLYRQAQVLAPTEPSLEANLGLSYSLTNELPLAERHLKRAGLVEPALQADHQRQVLPHLGVGPGHACRALQMPLGQRQFIGQGIREPQIGLERRLGRGQHLRLPV